MNMLSKINIYLDYDNHYTVNKAMRTLKREFDIAKKMSSPSHAKEVLQVAKHIHDNLTSMESTWPRRVLVKNFRKLINWMERGQRHVRNLDPENSNELVE